MLLALRQLGTMQVDAQAASPRGCTSEVQEGALAGGSASFAAVLAIPASCCSTFPEPAVGSGARYASVPSPSYTKVRLESLS